MEIFSWRFVAIFLIAIIILTMRARSKRKGPVIVRGKQISIRGQKLTAHISRQTDLQCLLDDGRKFGEDFKDKAPPQLPHSDSCQCSMENIVQHSHEIFQSKKTTAPETHQTDLGSLTDKEYRYYKYTLIANHPDADESTREDYKDLADHVPVDDSFKKRVEKHLEK